MKIKIFQFNMFGVNTYLLTDETTFDTAVVDPGMMVDGEQDMLEKYVAENHLRITRLINTHMHIDHVIGDLWVEKTYGVELEASPLEEALASRVAEQARMFGLPIDAPRALEIGRPLKGGDVVEVGDSRLEVISVPGHSPGSIALYDRADGFVLTGDALFAGSIGRTDLPGGDYPTLIRSISHGLLTLPPNTIVYPGHGPSSTIHREIQSNPYL